MVQSTRSGQHGQWYECKYSWTAQYLDQWTHYRFSSWQPHSVNKTRATLCWSHLTQSKSSWTVSHLTLQTSRNYRKQPFLSTYCFAEGRLRCHQNPVDTCCWGFPGSEGRMPPTSGRGCLQWVECWFRRGWCDDNCMSCHLDRCRSVRQTVKRWWCSRRGLVCCRWVLHLRNAKQQDNISG